VNAWKHSVQQRRPTLRVAKIQTEMQKKKERKSMHQNITSNPALAIAGLFIVASMASIPAQANVIPFTFNLTGSGSTPTGSTPTTLSITSHETGSFITGNPGLNAAWNPLTYTANEVIDLNTGLLNGTFSIVFADSSTLFGNVALDVSEVISPTGNGSFSGGLTFTGGTGEFAGATGSASGAGVGNDVSGNGTIDAPAVPEPAPIALTAIGIAAVLFRRIRKASRAETLRRASSYCAQLSSWASPMRSPSGPRM
jgi:hypothetical protein